MNLPQIGSDESNIEHSQSKSTCRRRRLSWSGTKELSRNPPDAVLNLEKDPVCGMNVNPASAKHTHAHAGKNHYFCCASCAEKFKTDPEKYLRKPAPTMSSGLVMLGAAPRTGAT